MRLYPRHRVENIEWGDSSWTYNLFRAFELVFGRRASSRNPHDTVRPEVSASAYRDGSETVVIYQFYTVEALLCHLESRIRAFFDGLLPKFRFVPIPILALSNGMQMPGWAPFVSFAIAFDTNANGTTANASSLTVNLTASGSNRIAFISPVVGGGAVGQTDDFTGLTVGGSATTQISTVVTNPNPSTRYLRLFYFIAPPTSSTAYTMTNSAPSSQQEDRMIIVTYSGASQTGQPDSSANNTATAANDLVLSTTVVGANCWLVSSVISNTGTYSAGTGTTQRDSTGTERQGDSNGTVSTGSQSMTWSGTAVTGAGIIASVAPVFVTSIKTWDGIANASLKTIQGVARASVKSWNGTQ